MRKTQFPLFEPGLCGGAPRERGADSRMYRLDSFCPPPDSKNASRTPRRKELIPFRFFLRKLPSIFRHIWVYMIKVHDLSQICVTTNLSPRSCSERPLECRKKRTKICTVKYRFLRRFLAPKWTGSSTFGHAERPPEVARSAVGPRHRLETLRRDVEKCLKTPITIIVCCS